MPSIDISRFDKKKQKKNGEPAPFANLSSILNKELSFGNGELKDRKKESLYLELSSLLKAGINLKTSLELVTADQQVKKDKELFTAIQADVVKGLALSEALKKSGKFSTYEVYSIQIGEESGKLNEVLADLAKYYQNKIKQRRKIVASLTYPCVVLTTSFGAVFFMLKFVVPMFSDVFKRFGGHLPWLTQKVIDISGVLEHSFGYSVFLIIIMLALFLAYRNTEQFRRVSSGLFLKMPLIGSLVQKIYLARFCNSMRLLINARVPLLRAVSLSRQMIGFYPIEVSLSKVEQDIMTGRSLHQSLQQFGIYPPKLIQMIKVGEETNQLDYFFARVSEQYIEEVEYKTSTLSSSMEPLIIIFLGLIVGVILISMYLPMFEMSNSIQ